MGFNASLKSGVDYTGEAHQFQNFHNHPLLSSSILNCLGKIPGRLRLLLRCIAYNLCTGKSSGGDEAAILFQWAQARINCAGSSSALLILALAPFCNVVCFENGSIKM